MLQKKLVKLQIKISDLHEIWINKYMITIKYRFSRFTANFPKKTSVNIIFILN